MSLPDGTAPGALLSALGAALRPQTEWSALSDVLRQEVGGARVAGDAGALAQEFGVSLRTAERWITGAGQQREFIPSLYDRRAFEELPDEIQRRVQFAREVDALMRGHQTQEPQEGCKVETARIQYRNVVDAVADAAEWGATGDPFLDQFVFRGRLTAAGGRWVIEVQYQRCYRVAIR